MSQYKGKPATVDATAAHIARKFNDLSVLNDMLDQLPADELAKLGSMTFEPAAIIIVNPQVGELRFNVTRADEKQIVLEAASIVPIKIIIDLEPEGDDGARTRVATILDMDVPMMLRPIIGGKMQMMADSFGQMVNMIVANGR